MGTLGQRLPSDADRSIVRALLDSRDAGVEWLDETLNLVGPFVAGAIVVGAGLAGTGVGYGLDKALD